MTTQLRYSLLALLSAVIAAVVWVITEIAVSYLATPAVLATMWGGLLGGLVLVVTAARQGELDLGSRSRSAWVRIGVGGLLIHGAGFVLSFIAAGLIGAGKSNLLGQVQTFFVVVLAVIIFLSYAFFTVLFQIIVAGFAPGLGIQVPQNLGMALIGGLLVAAGIVVLQGRVR